MEMLEKEKSRLKRHLAEAELDTESPSGGRSAVEPTKVHRLSRCSSISRPPAQTGTSRWNANCTATARCSSVTKTASVTRTPWKPSSVATGRRRLWRRNSAGS